MKSAALLYNELDGQTVKRSDLQHLADIAFDEPNFEVYERITQFLEGHPKPFLSFTEDSFEIEIANKIGVGCPMPGLAAPRHEGLAKEALTDCGRLKPGFKYKKGGEIVKVQKKGKIKLVVVDENTLGYIFPETPNSISILKASVLKGSKFNEQTGSITTDGKTVRLASILDFDDFNVSFEGYDNGDYEYQKNPKKKIAVKIPKRKTADNGKKKGDASNTTYYIDDVLSKKYNITRYGNKGFQINSSDPNVAKVLKIENKAKDELTNYNKIIVWAKANIDKIHPPKKEPKKEEPAKEEEKPKKTAAQPEKADNSKNAKRMAEFMSELEVIEKRLPDLEKELQELRNQPYYTGKFEITQEKQALIRTDKERQSKLMNLFVCLKNGGDITSITDKKGMKHEDIADFTNVSTSQIEWDEETILEGNLPPYIPILDQEALRGRGFVFDSIRVSEDTYLTATKSHDEKGTEYVLLTLDQLVLTSDYYVTFQKAIYKKAATDRTQRNLEYWDKMDDSKKERYYQQRAQQAVYNSMPAAVKKTISFDKWTALTWQEKEKVYKFYKRVGPKRIKSKLDSTHMWASMHKMYERFVNPKATNPKPRTAHPEVFAYWVEFREMMKFKIMDIGIARGDYSDARKKGNETSFGDSNTNDALLKEYGILAKRQNGDEISPQELDEVENAWKKVISVFGNLKPLAKAFGLKVSHTGKTLVYARKAVGVYWPRFHVVATSMKFGKEDFANTLAHEVAHFLDHQKGLMTGKRYESDNYESTAGLMARAFRKNMNEKTNSNYINSTKECLARAMEQYFAVSVFGEDAENNFTEMVGAVKESSYYNAANHVAKAPFEKEVVPLIKKFIEEIKTIEPQKESGLGKPDKAVKFLTQQAMDIGLGGVAATLALDNCGRLKPGFKFLKGGEIMEVEKEAKKSSSTTKKKVATGQKKTGSSNIKNNVTAAAKKLTPKQQFEKDLEAMKFKIFKIDTQYKSPKDFNRTYYLNYDDVGGVKVYIEVLGDTVFFDFEGLGMQMDDFVYTEKEGSYSDCFDDIIDYLKEKYSPSILKAQKLKEKYENTLYKKGDKNQLGLFGKAKPKKSRTRKFNTAAKRKAAKKKGLGTPQPEDRKPYAYSPAPERAADNGDAAASVLDMNVHQPMTVMPDITPVKTTATTNTDKKPGLVTSMDNVGSETHEHYNLTGDFGRFLGNVEIKPKESVVVTLDAPQGAMKTRLFFQAMNMYGNQGYKVLFYSGEEHKDSALFKQKRDQYLSARAQSNIDAVSDLPNGISDFYKLAPNYDIIFIDSWGKLTKKDKGVDMDEDIRKRFDGKKFYIIYQRTGTGTMRGGSTSQFDGDQIMKIHKGDTYEENYAYWDKNRYEVEPGLKYNIHGQKMHVEARDAFISGNPVQVI